MERRRKELSDLHDFIEGVDKEVKMVLHDLKWDRKRFLEDIPKATCSYEKSHKLVSDKMKCHERQCFLKCHGYDKDLLLPDPLDADANTLIKLDAQAIITIINNATCGNPSFKQGIRSQSPEPWTLERLQATYTMDERRAIHDAVVQAVPSCHDLADLALPSNEDGDRHPKVKSRAEILAELRDMKRRRAKYRVAAKTRKYSDVLRDVIKTQMELYTDTAHQTTKELDQDESMHSQKSKNQHGDDYEISVQSQKPGSSLKDNLRQKQQDPNPPGTFQRRNTEKSIPRESSHLRDRERRQPQEYYSYSYSRDKDRTMSQKVATSSVEEREGDSRTDYYSCRYKRGGAGNRPNESAKGQSRETRARQERKHSSSFTRGKNNEREPTSADDAREPRRRHEHSRTSRYENSYDNQTRSNRKKYTPQDLYTAGPRKRHGENIASSERDEIPSKRRHMEIRNINYHKTSRERNAERYDKVRIKLERDRTADRDLSDNETRYDYVYASSKPTNKHKRSKRDRRSREKYYHKSSHRRSRHEDDVSVKKERETSESSDSQSNDSRSSTYYTSNDYTTSSESDDTTSRRRDIRSRDYYNRIRHGQTNVRIKKERSESCGDEHYHRRTNKRYRQKHSRRRRSSEKSRSSSSSTDSDSRHGGRHKPSHGHDAIEETVIRIKKERNATPPNECGQKDSNSSWE